MTDHATSSLIKEDPPDASFVLTAAVHHALGCISVIWIQVVGRAQYCTLFIN